jgi:flagellar secretion chaperone FliS
MNLETTYRNSSVGGASPIGLMIALFDRLITDLRRAAEAVRGNDIEGRCRELNHALLILGQLETWIDGKDGGEPARQLAMFYSYLRARLLEASARQSAELFEAQMQTIVHIRSRWQLLEGSTGQVSNANQSRQPGADGGAVQNPARIGISERA